MQPETTLPPLSQHEEAILSHYLSRESVDLPSLAAELSIPLSRTLALATGPAMLAHLQAFDRYAEFRERSRQSAALSVLSDDLKQTTDPVERRRTATTILRASHNLLHARPAARKPTRHSTSPDTGVRSRAAQLLALIDEGNAATTHPPTPAAPAPSHASPSTPAPTYVPPASTSGPAPIDLSSLSALLPLRPIGPISLFRPVSSTSLASAAGAPP
jgi:hypothetical protein